MKDHISKLRKQYEGELLDRTTAHPNPIEQFKHWFVEALDGKVNEPNAMILATCNANGKPSLRTVLLKDFDEKGFTFYTNYNSRKGKEINENPFVSILFFWPELMRQIRIEGELVQIDPEISAEYFKERPRGSQVSAWISPQSQIIESKKDLEDKCTDFEIKYAGKDIPYPSFWGGYRLKPGAFEFWQGQPNRLHDRIHYSIDTESNQWHIHRLAP